MVFTPIETIALIVIILSVVKIFVLLVNPKSLIKVSAGFWKNSTLVIFISFILAGIIFYYLIQELTIVQILAVFMFSSLFMVIGKAGYIKEIINLHKKKINSKNFWGNGIWLYTLLWLTLLFFGVIELFF